MTGDGYSSSGYSAYILNKIAIAVAAIFFGFLIVLYAVGLHTMVWCSQPRTHRTRNITFVVANTLLVILAFAVRSCSLIHPGLPMTHLKLDY